MTQTLKALFLIISISIGLSGCVYKIDVQQGNIITDRDVAKIHRGMSALDVEGILGAPLLRNIYKGNQLYYVYTMKQGHKKMHRRNLTIYFKNGKVTHFTEKFATVKHDKH